MALQIKLDEIIRAIGKAENSFIDLEDRSQEELDQIKAEFATIAVKARNGKVDRRAVTVEAVKSLAISAGTNAGDTG